MYDNDYNRGVAGKISEMTKRMILRQDNQNHEADREHKITTRLEGMAMRNKDVHGGSGYAAATVGDHGYKEDSTVGAGRKRGKAAEQGYGMSAAGISAGGVQIGSGKEGVVCTPMQSGAGVSAAGVSAAGRRRKNVVCGGDLSLLHYDELKGQPAFTAPPTPKERCRR
jgi:hypothetical protein